VTYKQLIDDIHVEVAQPDEMAKISDEQVVALIHKYCQILSERTVVEDRVIIDLEPEEAEYELPEKPFDIKKVKHAELVQGEKRYPVDILEMDRLLDIDKRSITFQGTGSPRRIAFWHEENKRFLRVQPNVSEIKDEEDNPIEQSIILYIHALFYQHKLNALYQNTGQELPFPQIYTETLKWGIKQDIYGVLKQYELQQQSMQLFENSLLSNQTNRGVYHKIRITYR